MSPGTTARVDFHVIPASTTPEEFSLIYSNTSAQDALQQPKHQAKAPTVNLGISTLSVQTNIYISAEENFLFLKVISAANLTAGSTV